MVWAPRILSPWADGVFFPALFKTEGAYGAGRRRVESLWSGLLRLGLPLPAFVARGEAVVVGVWTAEAWGGCSPRPVLTGACQAVRHPTMTW